MARPPSQAIKISPSDLRATKGALDQRWIELKQMFGTIFEIGSGGQKFSINVEYAADAVWAGFVGTACERVERNRGGSSWVIPLCSMHSELFAWIGWEEAWHVKSGQRPFQFRNVGVTVYIGRQFEIVKPQLLRLEWPGVSNWAGSELSFQSPGAGHPHWQIDLLQSLSALAAPPNFVPDEDEFVEDFEAAEPLPAVESLVRTFSIERMHLASAATWWLPPVDVEDHHVNAPSDIADLTRWLKRSVSYLKQELGRCVVRK